MSKIKFEIVKKIGNLKKNEKACSKEAKQNGWNNLDPKYNIYEWFSSDKP